MVGRNDSCPCGSGIKYKKCCINKEKELKSIGRNWQGREIEFDDRTSKSILSTVIDYNTRLNKRRKLVLNSALKRLDEYYQLSDKNMNLFHKYSPCKMGCNECCHILVEISALEAEYIRRYIRENMMDDIVKEISDNIEQCKVHIPDYKELYITEKLNLIRDYFHKNHIRCPFLDEKGKCIIYDARPISCRHFMVFSDSTHCNYGYENQQYKSKVNEMIEYGVAKLSSSAYPQLEYQRHVLVKHIADWFIEGFDSINIKL